MNAEPFRLSIASTDQLALMGKLFGTLFLSPLLQEEKGIVVASYGPSGSGKSTFGQAAVSVLPDPYAQHAAQVCKSNIVTFKVPEQRPEFRYRDFWENRLVPSEEMLPRDEILKRDRRYAVGLDLLEHPPQRYVTGVDVVWLIRQQSYPEYARKKPASYFGKMMADINIPSHPFMRKLLSEMDYMKTFETPYQSEGKGSRIVSCVLMNQRPPFQRAFLNFQASMNQSIPA